MNDEPALEHRLKQDELSFAEWYQRAGKRVQRERAKVQRQLDHDLAKVARDVPLKDRWIYEAQHRVDAGRRLSRLTMFHEFEANRRRESHRAEYAAAYWHEAHP